jgi:hypothetical protein
MGIKGQKGFEDQSEGGYTKPEYAAEGKKVVPFGGRGELQDGKVSSGTKYPGPYSKGDGRTE